MEFDKVLIVIEFIVLIAFIYVVSTTLKVDPKSYNSYRYVPGKSISCAQSDPPCDILYGKP